MHAFVTYLKKRLEEGSLPGLEAQLKMAPEPVKDGPSRKIDPPPDVYTSSVLILLFPNEEGELELLLTLRSEEIDHGGQISLPGGRSDPGESPVETALREAREEVGIEKEAINILGMLSKLYVNHSKNNVTPVAGYLDYSPEFNLNPREVEEAFTVELDSLAAKKNITIKDWQLKQYTYKVPYWDIHPVPLWGATAMILSEFLELYREFKSLNPGACPR